MLNSKLVSVSKNGPTGQSELLLVNLRNISSGQIQSVTNMTDRQQLIAVDAYYLAVQRGFEGGYEVDWLEAEAEIMVCNQEDFNYQSSCNN
jgi:hypothetical protein